MHGVSVVYKWKSMNKCIIPPMLVTVRLSPRPTGLLIGQLLTDTSANNLEALKSGECFTSRPGHP